jgi:Domain of unknown function (DUF4105)
MRAPRLGSERVGPHHMSSSPDFWHSAALILATTAIVGFAGWTTIALWFQAPGTALRGLFIAGWLAFALGALLVLHRAHATLAIATFAVVSGGVLFWWHSLKPSNDRLWADDVARTTSGELHGDVMTLHNVRNFDWRSEADYTPRWERRSYDLRRLNSLDLITSYWDGPAIAHVLVSFGFDDGQQVVFSVEIRRQKNQKFSEIGGFFKAFELSVIAADERDVIRVRTNIRGEDDYLYRVRLPLPDSRALFLAYVMQMNELVRTPRFYNTITVNCTTLVYHMMQRIVGRLPFSYRVLLSGYLPGYVYSVGGLDQRYTLEQLRTFGRITERAKQADRSEMFSRDIRRGIPPLQPAMPSGN